MNNINVRINYEKENTELARLASYHLSFTQLKYITLTTRSFEYIKLIIFYDISIIKLTEQKRCIIGARNHFSYTDSYFTFWVQDTINQEHIWTVWQVHRYCQTLWGWQLVPALWIHPSKTILPRWRFLVRRDVPVCNWLTKYQPVGDSSYPEFHSYQKRSTFCSPSSTLTGKTKMEMHIYRRSEEIITILEFSYFLTKRYTL